LSPEGDLDFWRRENFFPPTGNQTPDRPAHRVDTNTDYAIPAFAGIID